MREISFIIGALAVLGGLYYFGVIQDYNIVHPFWSKNATMFGGLAGAALAFGLFWLDQINPKLARWLIVAIGLIFVASLYATTHFAKAFIDAEDFNRTAADIWHKGSYAVIASFVVVVTQLLRKALKKL